MDIPEIKKNSDQILNNLIRDIKNGNAVLFLGSGFSASAVSIYDERMSTASALSEKISKLGIKKFDAEGDLRYSSSRFLKENSDHSALIDMLNKEFTVKNIGNHHKIIASTPWRRVYTTNYDMCFERAAESSGLIFNSVETTDNPSEFSARNNICIHLNGSLKTLNRETIDTSFKLTESSYLSPESFLNSKWFYSFKRDLEFSSAVVFLGYSMYDIEVQKILRSIEDYKSKTYFVLRSEPNEKSKFTLEQFGNILTIGVEGFSEEISKQNSLFSSLNDKYSLSSLWKYEVTQSEVEVGDRDVDAFLMHGDVSDEIFDSSLFNESGAPLLIKRDLLKEARELIKAKSNLVITADFGNGKSVFLRSLRAYLAQEGMQVYTADLQDQHQHDDLEILVKNGVQGCLLVDSYEQNIELIEHFLELNPINLQLIIGARTSTHNNHRELFSKYSFRINELSIDEISITEAEKLISIIDNIGYWGEDASLSKNQKINRIISSNQGQISTNLLSIFSSPQIVKKVNDLISDTLKNKNYKDTIFSIALLSILDMQMSNSLISEIAFNDSIYTSDFRKNVGFNNFFKIEGNKIIAKSSIFSLALISHQFQSSYIVDQLLKIVESLDGENSEHNDKKIIRKNLLRFSVIERLLPSKLRIQNLVRYYENLKIKINWLQRDPHFWLQYGMALLAYKNYDKAQNCFDQAYSLARGRENYHTHPMDSQQARLYLIRSKDSINAEESYNFFKEAHQLIVNLPDDIHKYRQVEAYNDIFNLKFNNYSKNNKSNFKRACISLLGSLQKTIKEDMSVATSRRALRLDKDLTEIIKKIL